MHRMMRVEESRWRGLWRRIPLPVFALVFGLAVGAAAWLVIDRQQSAELSHIFKKVLDNQLHHVARESLIRFDQHRQSYIYLARLLANHRRLADYLESRTWVRDEPSLRVYPRTRPPWLPRKRIMADMALPAYIMLTDLQGRVREVFNVTGDSLPPGFKDRFSDLLAFGRHRALLTLINGQPFLLVSEPIENQRYFTMGALVMLVPLDSTFLTASQQSVASSQTITAIMDADAQVILSSSNPSDIEAGTPVDLLRNRYVLTAQSFSDYDGSDLNMLYATLVPTALYQQTGQAILDLERRQRAMGAAGIIGVFVLLFVMVSHRINRSLRRLQDFARRALGEQLQPLHSSGNRLLQLEDRIRDVIDLVLLAREETRTRHESELKHLEALRAGVMEASVDSIAAVDAEGKIIDFNPTAQRVFGRTLEQAKGRVLADTVFEEGSAQYFQSLLSRLVESGSREGGFSDVELTIIDREGRKRAMEVAIRPIVLDEQTLFTVYMRDTQERQEREAEVRALAAFPKESPSPVLRVNARGVITYANAPSRDLLDYWQCRPLQTLPVYWRERVEQVLRSGLDRETEIVTDNAYYSLLMTPIKELDYVNIYARDVTAQRRAEDALQQRQDELVHVARLSTMGEMSTGIAHELNQPLSAIVNFSNGCVRRLQHGIANEEGLLNALSQISVQAQRAAEIIKRLRALVTRQHLVRRQVDINQLISEVCDLLAHDLRKQEIAVEKKLAPVSLSVCADSVQIEQALINLVRNALDAMRSKAALGRRLKISSGKHPDGNIFVTVEDSGSGIDPDAMEHLFDAFYTTKDSGMGMGLAITQTIIEDHHGKIYADSSPGKGSAFTIELPANMENC